MNPRVKQVKVETNYQLRLTFQNDEVRLFDMKPYLSVGVFQGLKQPAAFRSVRAAFGSIQWKGGQDLCPDTLYEESVPIAKAHSMVLVQEKSTLYQGKPHKKSKTIRSGR